MMMMILVLFFLEFFFYFFSRRDLNPDRRFPVAAVTANGNVSTLKPTNESSYFSRSSRRSRRRRSLRQLSTTTRFDPATLDDDSRSGNPGHYGKLSTRILLLGHIHYAYLDRCTMLTRSTGVANTCRNLSSRRDQRRGERERARAKPFLSRNKHLVFLRDNRGREENLPNHRLL
jgi:hypothetical protein